MTQQSEAGASARASGGSVAGFLQIAANVAVIALCILVGWLALGRSTAADLARAQPIYHVGDAIDPVRGFDFSAARVTLVMVVREDCHFCRESLPFYRQVSEARLRRPDPGLRVIVASTDPRDALTAFLQSSGVHVDQVSRIEPGALKVPGTPSLLLVDQTGKILNVWRGKLADRQEREVLTALGLPNA